MENEPTVTLAPNAMTTLEDTMERLGIPPEAADTAVKNNIIRLINTASAWVETITGRKFGRQTYTQRYAASGHQELVLQQYPIRSVEYVKDTMDGVDINLDSYDFSMEGDVGVLYRDLGWVFRGYIAGLANDYVAPRQATSFPKTPQRRSRRTFLLTSWASSGGLQNRSSPSSETGPRALLPSLSRT